MKYLPCRLAIFSLFSLCQLHASPLPLNEAIEIVKAQNLEIKASTLSTQSAQRDIKAAQGAQYGSLNFTQTATRSNDAGNV
ncbi:MAG: TolC family protein, partial [Sulfuricurvum sp.]|nr:TolC family protein [Sulfuricurvum sp.]